jgi:hypothetical protein
MPVNTYTTFDDPSGTDTSALAINDAGQIVGDYRDATGVHGFLKSGGTYTTIDDPSAGVTVENRGLFLSKNCWLPMIA